MVMKHGLIKVRPHFESSGVVTFYFYFLEKMLCSVHDMPLVMDFKLHLKKLAIPSLLEDTILRQHLI